MILLGYVFIIIKNSGYLFSNEDIEEIASDVFLAVWKNKEKLDKFCNDLYALSFIIRVERMIN